MIVIRIQEYFEQAGVFQAKVSFDQGPEYSITVRDPFSKEEEERLEWYFEKHLEFPFTDQIKAQQAATGITTYGERLFVQVFTADPKLFSAYKTATQEGLNTIQIEIVGQPSFHALHWEALKDPELPDPLVLQTAIVRKNLIQQALHPTISPAPTINLLIVVARPRGRRDVGYRTISEPLVEALGRTDMPMQIEILRPGTYKALKNHLCEITDKRGVGFYHVIHFDVHGSLLTYDSIPPWTLRQRSGRQDLRPYEGLRAFLSLEGEQEDQAELIEAEALAALLLQHQIPIAILNACQSAKQVGEDETSLGSHLLQAGVPMVIAMGYSITVSAAELLMPTLYQQLFAKKDLVEAIRQGRTALYNHKARRAYFDQRIDLEDWILPVVYQNHPQHLALRDFTSEEREDFLKRQGQRYLPSQPDHGFVGRDLDILQIEKHLLTKHNILLVRGMGGVGKTTLLQHLGTWWQTTGFVDQVFYFSYYDGVLSHQQLLVGIAERVLGEREFSAFQPLSLHAQQVMLTQHLRAQRHLLVLDSLESITWALDEQAALRRFLARLTGGRTLVLLGSRGSEAWLAEETFGENIYDLEGLDAEAVSVLTEHILEQQGARNNRQDADLTRLLRMLNGFPLALEAVLANLSHQTPREVLTSLQSGDAALDEKNNQGKTKSILSCIDHSYSNLSPEVQDLLFCLTPYTLVISRPLFGDYANLLRQQTVLSSMPLDRWEEMVQQAKNWGLLRADPEIPDFLHLHPLLPYFLRSRFTTQEDLERRKAFSTAFLQLYEGFGNALSDWLHSKEPAKREKSQMLVDLEFENFMSALDFALAARSSVLNLFVTVNGYLALVEENRRGLELAQYVLDRLRSFPKQALSESWATETWAAIDTIAKWQLDLRRYAEAEASYQTALDLFVQLENIGEKTHSSIKAGTYYNLASVAMAQREWVKAEEYCKRALQIFISTDEHVNQASVYHTSGSLAKEQNQLTKAEQYYQQALQILIKFNDRQLLADNYLSLGQVTLMQDRLIEAQQHYLHALPIYIEFNERINEASVYHDLGILAEKQGQWTRAKYYYQQALQIQIDLGDHYHQAEAYAQLGIVAKEEGQLAEAVQYYQKSLPIFKKFNDLPKQNIAYSALGILAREQQQWAQAEEYFQYALQIRAEIDDRPAQAEAYTSLGTLVQDQQQWARAEEYYRLALSLYREVEDLMGQADLLLNLSDLASEQNQWEQAVAYCRQALPIIIQLDDSRAQTRTYLILAQIAKGQSQWMQAEEYYQRALQLVIELNDHAAQATIFHQLGFVAGAQHRWAKAEEYYQHALSFYRRSKDHPRAWAEVCAALAIIAKEQRQWPKAEEYYRELLQANIELNDRPAQAEAYYQCAALTQEQHQWARAEEYYLQALHLAIELNDQYKQALVYHRLGRVTQEQHHLDQAQKYYQLALPLFNDSNNRTAIAAIYNELGLIAYEQERWSQAEEGLQLALQIYTDLDDHFAQAYAYDNLGNLAQAQEQWTKAEKHYQSALRTYTALDDRLACAGTFHNLGVLAQEQGQWTQAEQYYQQALRIFIDFEDLYNQAGSYYQLGIVALEQSHWPQAHTSFLSALKIYKAYEDTYHLEWVLGAFARLRQSSGDAHLPTAIASILDITPQGADILLDQMLDDEADKPAN